MDPQLNSSSVAEAEAVTLTLTELPLSLSHRIFLALRVDERGRACCVSRGWRDVLAEPGAWLRLDLSDDCGVPLTLDATALLEGASRRAQGQLVELSLGSRRLFNTRDVLPVLAANSGSLRELHLGQITAIGQVDDAEYPNLFEVRKIVQAAPQLQLVDVFCMGCFWDVAPGVLRAEGALAPVRLLHRLWVRFLTPPALAGSLDTVAPFAAAFADAALQPALSQLDIMGADTQQLAVMNALVDAVMARPQLRELTFQSCTPPAPAPLARMLRDGTLPSLSFVLARDRDTTPLFNAAGALIVANALRANKTLTALSFGSCGLLVDTAAAVTILGALVGHPNLTSLVIDLESAEYYTPVPVALVTALAALIAADAPALRRLRLMEFEFNDLTIAPVVNALAENHHLRVLDFTFPGLSADFTRERLAPALARLDHRWARAAA
jgi:hypothetical protein